MIGDSIPSPFSPQPSKRITQAEWEQVKKILGVQALLIVSEENEVLCDGADDCLGHLAQFTSEGFTSHALRGVAAVLNDAADNVAESYKDLE